MNDGLRDSFIGNPGMVLTYRSGFSTTLAYWVTGSVVILLALSVVIYLLLRRKMFPRLSLDDFNSTAESGLLRENPSSSTGVIPILFLYSSRSMSRLARHVSHLKEAIRNYVPNSLVCMYRVEIKIKIHFLSNRLTAAGIC
jgi:hypothetical protein